MPPNRPLPPLADAPPDLVLAAQLAMLLGAMCGVLGAYAVVTPLPIRAALEPLADRGIELIAEVQARVDFLRLGQIEQAHAAMVRARGPGETLRH